jgi:hypothetical protein
VPRIEVKAFVDRTTATIADRITYTISALYVPDIQITMPEVGSQIAGLRIVDFGEEGPGAVDNRLEFTKWYRLQADIAGTYIIPSMGVAYTDKDAGARELKTPQIFIQVTSALAAAGNEGRQDIIDIKPLEQPRRDLRPFVIGGAAVLVVALAAAGALVYVRRRRKLPAGPPTPAHVLALEAFERLQQERLIERGVVHEHYFRLSDIFRRYLENRFNVPAVEQTTQELLPEISKLPGVSPAVLAKARNFLVHADLVKFAKHAPAAEEIAACHTEVLDVIQETKQEERPEAAPAQ